MKRRAGLIVIMLVLLLAVMTACSSNDDSGMRAESSVYQSNDDMDSGSVEDDAATENNLFSSNTATTNTKTRKVIYTGDISLEVKDFRKTEALIEGKINKLNGYIVDSSFHDYQEGEIIGMITVRIPQESFTSFIEDLKSDEIKVVEKNISGNDVTEEYIDLESRLKSKQTVEERLLSFMDKATTTEELLAVSNDLSQVQAEIEQLLGRIKYLNNQVDYSTIHIHIQEKNALPTLKDGQPLNTWENGKNLFIETINSIISFFSKAAVLIIGLSPILIPVGILAIAVILYKKKRKKRSSEE